MSDFELTAALAHTAELEAEVERLLAYIRVLIDKDDLADDNARLRAWGNDIFSALELFKTQNATLEAKIYQLLAENEQLRKAPVNDLWQDNVNLQAENERLQELLRGVGANRYWEGRWRDEKAENARLRAEVNYWNADARRLSGGLMAIHQAKDHIPASVLKSVAYDVCLNCLEPDTAAYQIERRALENARD